MYIRPQVKVSQICYSRPSGREYHGLPAGKTAIESVANARSMDCHLSKSLTAMTASSPTTGSFHTERGVTHAHAPCWMHHL